jgi:hypothetical protein
MAKVLLSISVDAEVKKELEKRVKDDKHDRNLSSISNEVLKVGISKTKSK